MPPSLMQKCTSQGPCQKGLKHSCTYLNTYNMSNNSPKYWLILGSPARPSLFVFILRLIIFHFRLNSHYIFFLLQVTEAVNLKRAEMTAFRKANRLTQYTGSFLKESDKSTLQRTNQGYKQFKSMRGTAPYFEQQKLRLFSMIRWENELFRKHVTYHYSPTVADQSQYKI